MDSNEYNYKKNYIIPYPSKLSELEKEKFNNDTYIKNLLLYGEKVYRDKDDFTFDYILFPKLNVDFFDLATSKEYYLMPDNVILAEVDRANTDILSKSANHSYKKRKEIPPEQDLKNYIYLTFIELFTYTFWYIDSDEKDRMFKKLKHILSNLTNFEIEIFDELFETLNKFNEFASILDLYRDLQKKKIIPSSFIYSTVNLLRNKIQNKIIQITKGETKKVRLKRQVLTKNQSYILSNKIIFITKFPCYDCENTIEIDKYSIDYKSIFKYMFWLKCPSCSKNIAPQLNIILGNELRRDSEKYQTSKKIQYTLHSPYELKFNIKNLMNKEESTYFRLDELRKKYPSIFWSCIWYFKLIKINIDIIIPYEDKPTQEWDVLRLLKNFNKFSFIKDREDQVKCPKLNIHFNNKPKVKIKKYSSDTLYIQNLDYFKIDRKKVLEESKNRFNKLKSFFGFEIIEKPKPPQKNRYGRKRAYAIYEKTQNFDISFNEQSTLKKILNNINSEIPEEAQQNGDMKRNMTQLFVPDSIVEEKKQPKIIRKPSKSCPK